MRASPPMVVLRTIAAVEAAKGLLAFVVGLGLVSLLHTNVAAAAEQFLRFGHFDPAGRYPQVFLDATSRITDSDLWLLAALAFLYAAIRGCEAYWLWNARLWAEWFALGSTTFYLPVELYEVTQHPSSITVGVLLVNLAIVAYLAWALRHDYTWSKFLFVSRSPTARAAAPSGNPT